MNTGQLQLIVGALMLLATVQLWINSAIIRSYVDSYDSDATIEAVSIGQGMANEAMTKAFDEAAVGHRVYSVNLLTPANALGPDFTTERPALPEFEPYTTQRVFDDFDDYQGYTRIVTSTKLGAFTVRDSVCYVRPDNLDAVSSTPTWYKAIVVTVTHKNLLHPVVIRSLKSYRRYF